MLVSDPDFVGRLLGVVIPSLLFPKQPTKGHPMLRFRVVSATVIWLCIVQLCTAQSSQSVIWKYDSADVSASERNYFNGSFTTNNSVSFGTRGSRYWHDGEGHTDYQMMTGHIMNLQINHNTIEQTPDGIRAVRIIDKPIGSSGDKDWHTQVTIRGPEGSNDFEGSSRELLKEGHTYILEFDVEVIDSYPSSVPESDKWWNSRSFTVVQQIWRIGGSPPFAIYLYDRDRDGKGEWVTRLNRIGPNDYVKQEPFRGPGTYKWKVVFCPDSDGTNGGRCITSVRGPNTSTRMTFKTGQNMDSPNTATQGPKMQFGAYTRLATNSSSNETVELRYDKIKLRKWQ